nr:reverse transcriptase domain-containing protein [Tanacetum cinerariifolium]
EAWDRFKDLLRACPYHGFSKLHQLDTFYNALNLKDQDSLNFADGSNFLDKMPRECLAIIESKSKVRYSSNKPVVAKVRRILLPPPPMATFIVTIFKNSSLKPPQLTTTKENTSYRPLTMSNQIRPPSFPPVPNNQNVQLTYQAPAYQAPTPQTQDVSKEDFSAYVKANDAVMRNMKTQGQNMQNQLTNLTDLLTTFVNSNNASTSSPGTLPSITIANLRSDLKAITTRGGVSYDRPQIPPSTFFLLKVVQSISPILTSKPVNSLIIEPVSYPVSALRTNLKPSIPYPSRMQDQKLCDKANDQRTPLNEHCSAVLLKKLPKKLGDLGNFLILCDFPRKAECLALADLGASINLMPLSMWNKLSLPDLTPTCMTLELPDRSISHPVRVAEDIYVKEGTFHFSADFIVIDFDAEPRVPLILGRSFLKTGRALIDVFEGELTLHVGNYMPEVRKELKICEAKSDKSSIDEPPEVELKYLPPYLEYAFLEGDDKFLVIIAKGFSMEEKTALITVLKSHKRAIAWKLSDIKGHTGFYRRFIKDFSKIARPMTGILEKDTPFHFSKECVEAFQTLKRKLTEAPILIAPYWDMPFELMCDASDFSIGAVLGQRQDKHFRPIHYVSKTMTEAESNYTTTEKEMLVMVYAFEKFRSYLIMNKGKFTFKVIDTKGAENLAADHLSRLENPHQNVPDPKEINESFPLETLNLVSTPGNSSTSWFADFENYVWGIDFMGPFLSSRGNKYILVAVDYLSK